MGMRMEIGTVRTERVVAKGALGMMKIDKRRTWFRRRARYD